MIEKPIRFGKHSKAKTIMLLLLMITMGCLGYNCYKQDGFKGLGFRGEGRQEYSNYFINSLPEQKYFHDNGILEKYRNSCDFYGERKYLLGKAINLPRKEISVSCYKRDTPNSNAVFIWGDSHAQQLYFGLKNYLPKKWEILQVTSSGCTPQINIKGPSTTNYCIQSNYFALKAINETKPNVVIVAQDRGHNIDSINQISDKLLSLGVNKIIFIGPTPHWTAHLSDIILRKMWPDIPKRTYIGIDKQVLKNNLLMQEKFPHADTQIFLNIIDFFCNQDGCLTYIGEDKKTGLTTWDNGHLTPIASDFLAKNLLVRSIIGSNTENSLKISTGLD
jgi:hypothetical protein